MDVAVVAQIDPRGNAARRRPARRRAAVKEAPAPHSFALRAPIGRGRPAKRFGGLAWLPHRGSCGQGCTQTEGNRGHVVRLQRAVGSVNGRICEEGALLNVTYLILVSEPLTPRAAASCLMPVMSLP